MRCHRPGHAACSAAAKVLFPAPGAPTRMRTAGLNALPPSAPGVLWSCAAVSAMGTVDRLHSGTPAKAWHLPWQTAQPHNVMHLHGGTPAVGNYWEAHLLLSEGSHRLRGLLAALKQTCSTSWGSDASRHTWSPRNRVVLSPAYLTILDDTTLFKRCQD